MPDAPNSRTIPNEVDTTHSSNRAQKSASIGSSSIWNLAGAALPLLAGLVALPIVIDHLGLERFGILALVWLALGYFGLFDLGIGRSMTLMVAEARGSGADAEVPAIFATCCSIMMTIACVGTAVLFWLATPAVQLLSITPELHAEATNVFQVAALGLPTLIATAGIRGFLEAHHAFRYLNVVRIPFGFAHYLAPLAIALTGGSLLTMVVWTIILKTLLLFILALRALRLVRLTAGEARFDRHILGRVTRLGGWLTVSNIVGPLMVYMDSFVISGLVGAGLVAFYSVPYEVVTKLWIVSGAIISAMFPMLVELNHRRSEEEVAVFSGAVGLLVEVLSPVILLGGLAAPVLLALWLGDEFAAQSTPIARLMLIGVFINCVAQFIICILHGRGYMRLTALFHLLELPLYAAALWLLLEHFGVVGAAIAWLLRAGLDTVLLTVASYRLAPAYQPVLIKLSAVVTVVVLAGLSALLLQDHTSIQIFVVGLSLLGLARFIRRLLSAGRELGNGGADAFWRSLFSPS